MMYECNRALERTDGERSKIVFHGFWMCHSIICTTYVGRPILDRRHRNGTDGIAETRNVAMMMTKTIKTPLMTAVAFGPTFCSSGFVPKSELLHSP